VTCDVTKPIRPPAKSPENLLHRHGVRTPAGYNGLMERMARKLGLNIGRELETGSLQPEQLNRMLNRCTACGDVGGCVDFLNSGASDTRNGFEHCPNRKFLIHLRDQARAKGRRT